jgi:hypothetical protein
VPPDRELGLHALLTQTTDMGEQRLAGAGTVAADQHRVAVSELVRGLRQRLIENGDQVGGGVRAGIARAQHPREGLVAVAAERKHRVEAGAAGRIELRLGMEASPGRQGSYLPGVTTSEPDPHESGRKGRAVQAPLTCSVATIYLIAASTMAMSCSVVPPLTPTPAMTWPSFVSGTPPPIAEYLPPETARRG